jgi:hypothetical protein
MRGFLFKAIDMILVKFDPTIFLCIYQSRRFNCGGEWEGFQVNTIDNYFLYII